jgi:hypothetical protein
VPGAALQRNHFAGLDVHRGFALDGQRQLAGQQREHVVSGIVVGMHPPDGTGLGVVAQHPELRVVDHHHRRDPGIALNRAGSIRAADRLCRRPPDRQQQHRRDGRALKPVIHPHASLLILIGDASTIETRVAAMSHV